jgi:caffeoyl-CoA O-methyltransferase
MAEVPKSFHLSPEVHAYLVGHGTPPDELQRSLIEETRKLGGVSIMQIAPEQGAFMTLLARAIPEDGKLLCCDVSEEWAALARRYFEKAGVAHKIELRIAPAVETLRQLPESQELDFAFIDADKPSYPLYYEEILRRMRPGGLLLADNVLWMGRVADPAADDEQTQAIRAFNDLVARDERVDRVMLPISDGLTIVRKR